MRVEVEDSGIGIPKERIDQLFRPFSQVDASARRRFGGTGLGLAICRSLIGFMGGQTGIVSTVGVGSTFWFEVPCEPFEAETRPTPPVAPERHGPRTAWRVLLVEDNPVNQVVTGEMLKLFQCDVTVAADGVVALAELARRDFDLVLMDGHMPRLDGWTTTRELRAREQQAPGTRDPAIVIAQTASCMPRDVQRCKDAGMNGILPKPIQLEALSTLLSRLEAGDDFQSWEQA